ncbi:MAG: hypothetical protein K2I90_00150, partial [Odoribacter sp.]|nr:hypothetical protein [Odoribacter sp.]
RNGSTAVVFFDLEIFRPVKEWNNNDTTLGSSDFVFGKAGKDLSTVFKNVQVQSLHASIAANQSAALRLESRFVLGKLQISLTDLENSTPRLKIPYREWVKLCRVELPLVDPKTVELGLVWDHASTGMITRNIPILDDLRDDLDKIPDKILNFEDYSSSLAVCSGEEFFLFAHAVSSGNGLNCIWQYSVDKGKTFKDLPSVDDWKGAADGFQYRVEGENADTLWVRNLTADANGMLFKCVAEDVTVSEEKRETPEMVLTIWPEVQVALEGYASKAEYEAGIGKPADTIRHCPGENGFARVAFYGIKTVSQVSSLKKMGNVYVVYQWVNELGSDGRDTLVVNMSSLATQSFSWNGTSVVTAEKLQLKLPEDGKYFIHDVWTDSCRNATILAKFDTVVLHSSVDNVALEFDPIEYVAGSGDIDITEGLEINFTQIHLQQPSVGDVMSNYYEASAGKVGKDTVLYTYTAGSCTVTATRVIDVISSKHVAIKVLLEGPYIAKADSMRCIYEEDFPNVVGKYTSPYADKKEHTKPFPSFDRGIVDWIYVEVWDYPPYGLVPDDPKRGVLVDSTSALLLSDGRVVGIDGNPYVSFDKLPANDYYVKIRHRNHLSIMSAKPVTFASGTPKDANTIDFTAKLENVLDVYIDPADPALKNISGRYAMFGGDLNGDGLISVKDVSSVAKNINATGYLVTDLNFDGQVSNASDKKIVKNNLNVYLKF